MFHMTVVRFGDYDHVYCKYLNVSPSSIAHQITFRVVILGAESCQSGVLLVSRKLLMFAMVNRQYANITKAVK